MKYEFLEHTADAKFRAYGKTLSEAFENAAYAMEEVITDYTKVKPLIKKTISVESENKEALLYDFLEQFIFLLDSENFLLNKIEKIEIKDNRLTAEIVGDNKIDDYDIKTSIKAVTYQEMFIKQDKDQVVVQVIVDI